MPLQRTPHGLTQHEHIRYFQDRVGPIIEELSLDIVMEQPEEPAPSMIKWLLGRTRKDVSTLKVAAKAQLEEEVSALQADIAALEAELAMKRAGATQQPADIEECGEPLAFDDEAMGADNKAEPRSTMDDEAIGRLASEQDVGAGGEGLAAEAAVDRGVNDTAEPSAEAQDVAGSDPLEEPLEDLGTVLVSDPLAQLEAQEGGEDEDESPDLQQARGRVAPRNSLMPMELDQPLLAPNPSAVGNLAGDEQPAALGDELMTALDTLAEQPLIVPNPTTVGGLAQDDGAPALGDDLLTALDALAAEPAEADEEAPQEALEPASDEGSPRDPVESAE